MAQALSGLRVLTTRPRGQSDELTRLLALQGATAVELPMLKLEPVGDDAALRQSLQAAMDFDGWIFTSVNAVDRLRALGLTPPPNCYAIGPATARALNEAGCATVRLPPTGSNSEALLQHPELMHAEGCRFLLCAGEGGRGLIEETLKERRAEVRKIALYRRVPEAHAFERIDQAVKASDATVCTSAEGLQQLHLVTDRPLREALQSRLLVVSSPRVLEIAKQLGFEKVHAPSHTSDEALVDCLVQASRQSDSDHIIMTDDAAKPDASQEETPKPAEEKAPKAPEAAPPPAPQPAAPVQVKQSSAGTVVAVAMGVIILALLAVTGYAGWLLIQERTQLLDRIQAQNEKIAGYDARVLANSNGLTDLKGDRQETLRRLEATQAKFDGLEKEFGGLQQQVKDGLTQVDQLSEEISGGRKRFELASVEHLLTLANDRLLISGDVRGALIALEGADARLGRLADPQMFGVRAALSDEIAALRTVEVPDIAAATLSLASQIQKVSDLPLRSEAPQEFAAAATVEDGKITTDEGWDRFLESVKIASKQLFTVRRDDDQGVLRLLSPAAETAVYDILTLKLEGARVSLLKGDSESARAQLRSASGWLNRQFRDDDSGVVAMRKALDELSQLELEPQLPDISKSLTTLRRKLNTEE